MTAPRSNRLLIDADEFKRDVEDRIANAKTRIYVQAMTFECDGAGNWLVDQLNGSHALEKVMCIDTYSNININDGWAFGWRYWRSASYRKEVNKTRAFLRGENHDGILRHVTNKLGFALHRFPARNHKKMLIVDDVAYIGGLNFSDHNFEWHDLMARIDDPEIVNSLAEDFHETLAGRNQSRRIEFSNGRLFFLDGSNSRMVYDQLFEEIESADQTVRIISPYVSNPLLERLDRLGDKIRVQIITPEVNNKSIMKHYLLAKTRNRPWDIFQYGEGMSHTKALLIDDKKLIIGSSNFDFVSYHLEQEVVWITEDMDLITEFKRRIWETDMAKSSKESHRKGGRIGAIFVIFVASKVMWLLGLIQMKKS